MSDLSVNRTLVKSPPELWSELSEVESLARHLGEFGQIRITKLEPEHTVAWEGDHASGTVAIEASGWGTKVTITVAVAEAQPSTEVVEGERSSVEDSATEADSEPELEPSTAELAAIEFTAATRPAATEPEPPAREPEAPAREPEPELAESAAAGEVGPPRRGFFGRFFGRRRPAAAPAAAQELPRAEPPSPAPPAPPTVSEPVLGEREPAAAPREPVAHRSEPVAHRSEPVAREPRPTPGEAEREPEPDPRAEPDPPPRAMGEQRALEVLDGALQDLGAAHHRPFSRG